MSRLTSITKSGHTAYDRGNIALVLDSGGNVIERELDGPGTDQALASENGTTNAVNWFLTDPEGTVHDVAQYNTVAQTTSIADHLVYTSFGQLTSQTQLANQPRFLFQGAYQDPQTGLEKMGLRWYDAVDAVFASYDPIGFWGGQANLSEFVGNDPTNFIDPTGMDGEGALANPVARGGRGGQVGPISGGPHGGARGGPAGGAHGGRGGPGGHGGPGGRFGGPSGNGDGYQCPCCTQAYGIRYGNVDLPEDYDGGIFSEQDHWGGARVVWAGGGAGGAPGFGGGGPGILSSIGGTLSSWWDAYSNFIVENVYGGEGQAAAFGQSTTNSWTSMQLGALGIEQYFYEGDTKGAEATWNKGYELGPFGQTKNADPIIYYGTRGAVAVSACAASAAAATLAAEAWEALLSCFPAGTLVATPRGLFPIETLKPGDEVWAYDLVKSQWFARPILKTFVRELPDTSAFITVGGDTVQSTSLHPFWVVSGEDLANRPIRRDMVRAPEGCTTVGRWVYAADVRVGDELLARDGRILRVEAVEHRPFHDKVYNFHVAELETYAVGANSVLVHNVNSFGAESAIQREISHWKTYIAFWQTSLTQAELDYLELEAAGETSEQMFELAQAIERITADVNDVAAYVKFLTSLL